MKKFILLLGVATLCYGAPHSINYESNKPQQADIETQQKAVSSDCSHLSDAEKAFAAKLSDMHRTMFCRHFSVSQRLRAMNLNAAEVEALTGKKVTITPDEAVEAVMKDARQGQTDRGSTKGQGQQGKPPYTHQSYPSNRSSQKQQTNPYSNY